MGIKVNTKQLESDIKALEGNIKAAKSLYLREMGDEVEKLMRQEVPIDTGNLRDSVTTFKQSEDSMLVGHNTSKTLTEDGQDYGRFNYYGTRTHFVAPRNKKALNWGGNKFSKGHVVRGIRPNKWIERTEGRVNSSSLDEQVLKSVLRKVGLA